MRILIVDDSKVIQKAIAKYIQKFDLKIVGQAGDGKEALAMFREKDPDIVTLDITMPEMDGLTCLEEMLKIKKETSIIIVSAMSARKTALTAMEKGAVAFVSKPFNEEKMSKTLEKILEKRKND